MSDLSQKATDEGTIEVLLQRAKGRIRNLLAVKQRLLEGNTLSDIEIVELDSMLEHANDIRPLLDRHPEFHEIVVKMISMYNDITALALANEEKLRKPPGNGPAS